MATPQKTKTSNASAGNFTPKLGRGITKVDQSFESNSINQSGSKEVHSNIVGFNDAIIKRKTELAEIQRSTSKKRMKRSEVRATTSN